MRKVAFATNSITSFRAAFSLYALCGLGAIGRGGGFIRLSLRDAVFTFAASSLRCNDFIQCTYLYSFQGWI